MIGFISQPTGRLGNVLLQYLFLRQMASRTNSGFYHPCLKGADYFEDLDETDNYKEIKKKVFGKKKIGIDKIRDMGLDELAQYINTTRNILVLVPPVLGYTFDTLYEDPNNFLKIKKEFKNPYFDYNNHFVVAMHFRGTDFAEWNPMACLDAEYYIRAIDYCINKYGSKELVFSLFTDDLTIDSYKETVDYLRKNNCVFHEGDPQRNLGEECYNISFSDVVVSSPSTFAITASMLGKRKTIIHSQKWCDYSVKRNDIVWVQMMKNKCDYYKIECVL